MVQIFFFKLILLGATCVSDCLDPFQANMICVYVHI